MARTFSVLATMTVVTFAQLGGVGDVQAQPDATIADSSAPDVVRLRNGGMLRGMISELVPGDFVVIRLPSGEDRRVPMGDVEYAGPAAEMPAREVPPAPPPSPPVTPPPAPPPADAGDAERPTVRFRGDQPGLVVHYRTGTSMAGGVAFVGGAVVPVVAQSATHQRLCAIPCDVELAPGNYLFAVSNGEDSQPVAADDSTDVADRTRLRVSYDSDVWTRIGGLLVLVAGIVGGSILVAAGLDAVRIEEPYYRTENDPVLMTMGLLTVGIGTAIGLVMMFDRDDVSVSAD